MAFNGSGIFQRIYNFVIDRANGQKPSAERFDAELQNVANGLSMTITTDGQSTVTADIPFNGKKLVNIGAAAVGTDALNRDTGDGRYLQTANAGTISGNLGATGNLIAGVGQNASYIEMRDISGGTRFIHNNDSTIGTLASGGGWTMRVYDSGAVWTAQFGDLNTRIEDRAYAHANDRGYAWRTDAINNANAYTNGFISSIRWVDGGYDEWNSAGNNANSPYHTNGVMKEFGLAFGSTSYAAGGAVFIVLQAHSPNTGWFNV